MFLDKNLYAADGLAYGTATSSEIDLGLLPGNSDDIGIWIEGAAIAAAGAVTIDVQSSATSGSGHATDMLLTMTPAEMNAGGWWPINGKIMNRYVQFVLGGSPSAGTWTVAICDRRAAQTAR